MNFKETLAEKTVHAEDVLTKYLPEEKGYQKKVIESMNYSVLAGGKRLRPILMTSITTILGLIVMALGQSEATSLIQPLAVTCIGGLLYATLMTLFVVPCMYDMMNKKDMQKVDESELQIVDM